MAPVHHARFGHAVAYFEGKLIAAGGYEQASVECFALSTGELTGGQWVIWRPMSWTKALFGIPPFGEDLLFVSKCKIGSLQSVYYFVDFMLYVCLKNVYIKF